MGYIIWLLVSLLMSVGIWFAPATYFGTLGKFIVAGVGGLSMIALAIIVVVTKLYQKAGPDEALVRTGQGGRKVVVDGGILFIEFLHRMVRIPLETMRIEVKRTGGQALITSDYLRANISSEFYVRVEPNKDDNYGSILAFARSIGEKAIDKEAVKSLVEDKLISALRTVAAKSTLFDLNSNREKFGEDVMEAVRDDLEKNGLTLETVTISDLDQTPLDQLSVDNVFDAQGRKTIAEITRKAAVETNDLERAAEQKIAERDVETRKFVLEQELERERAEASKQRDKKNAEKEAERQASEFAIEQDEAVALRDVKRDEAVKLADLEKQKKTEMADKKRQAAVIGSEQEREVADKQRQQAVEVAEVAKNEAMEVAKRNKEIAIAQKEKDRAEAEAARLAAEAQRETNDQAVKTVEVVESAKRDREQAVIAAEAQAQSKLVSEQKEADAKAYRVERDAQARKAAAEADYMAKVKAAEAAKTAAEKEADGEQARAMVPVTVAAKQVEVDRDREMIKVRVSDEQVAVDRKAVDVESARVEVMRQELAQKAEFDGVAVGFELQKAKIEAMRDVAIAQAGATADMLKGAKMEIYGDPDTVANMTGNLTTAMGFEKTLQGLTALDPTSVVGRLTNAAVTAAEGAAQRLTPEVKTETPAKGKGDTTPPAAPTKN